jgi:uncharacterized protein
MEYKISYNVNNEKISGVLSRVDEKDDVNFLIMHGAGNSGKERTAYLSDSLNNHGISTFRFDFSGHGESSGDIKKSSLKKRIDEALVSIEQMKCKKPLTIIATSMGCEIAIRLTQYKNVKNLILFCPAIYSRDAFDVQFDAGFSDIIRKENSWENSECIDILSEFTGNLFIYIGENDKIIPFGVIKILNDCAVRATHKELNIINEAGHQIHSWLQEKPEYLNAIILKIVKYHH